MNFIDILIATLPVFLMVAVGGITRVVGILNDDTEKSVMKLVLWVLYPCFIFWKVPGNESLQNVSLVGIALSAGFLITVLAFLIAWLLGWFSGIDSEERPTFCVSTALQNYGFIPIPLIAALFEKSIADETVGVLFVHNLGLEIAMWTIGLIILSGKSAGAWKKLINGPTIAITAGLILNFSGAHTEIPSFVKKAVAELGACSIPVALILVGAALAGVIQKEKLEINWRVIFGSVTVRFIIMPLVFLGAAALLSSSKNLQRVLIIQSAMPAAIFPVVLAKHFGGKPGVATQIVIATSLLSLIVMPLILSLALPSFGFAGPGD